MIVDVVLYRDITGTVEYDRVYVNGELIGHVYKDEMEFVKLGAQRIGRETIDPPVMLYRPVSEQYKYAISQTIQARDGMRRDVRFLGPAPKLDSKKIRRLQMFHQKTLAKWGMR